MGPGATKCKVLYCGSHEIQCFYWGGTPLSMEKKGSRVKKKGAWVKKKGSRVQKKKKGRIKKKGAWVKKKVPSLSHPFFDPKVP